MVQVLKEVILDFVFPIFDLVTKSIFVTFILMFLFNEDIRVGITKNTGKYGTMFLGRGSFSEMA